MAHMIRFTSNKIINISSQLDAMSLRQKKIESLLFGLLTPDQMSKAMKHFNDSAQSGISQVKHSHIDLSNEQTFVGPRNKPSIKPMTGMIAEMINSSMEGSDEITNLAHHNVWNAGHLTNFMAINDLKLCRFFFMFFVVFLK